MTVGKSRNVHLLVNQVSLPLCLAHSSPQQHSTRITTHEEDPKILEYKSPRAATRNTLTVLHSSGFSDFKQLTSLSQTFLNLHLASLLGVSHHTLALFFRLLSHLII